MFSDLFKGKKVEKIDRIVSFLAILELISQNEISADFSEEENDFILTKNTRGKK